MTRILRCTLLLLSLLAVVIAQDSAEETCAADGTCATTEPETCVDQNEKCELWASKGECLLNPRYMMVGCRASCLACSTTINLNMGLEQVIDANLAKECRDIIALAREYVNYIRQDPEMTAVAELCENKHESCAYWAVLGECDKNPTFMKTNCAPVCFSCDELSVLTRCPLDPNAPNLWGPGDLNQLFLNLTTLDEFQQFEPKVWSRPEYLEGDTNETADYILGPWVVTLENVMNDEEAERLIELGAIEGYQRSADVGKMRADGTFDSDINNGRTSTNAWCQNACYQDPTAVRVMERVSRISNSPEVNSEYLQLLKYEEGQFYQIHHDYIAYLANRQPGARLLTVFLYLNDVEAGGGTNFPDLNITVMPKRGRALLWPSVLNDAPNEKDGRTEHQALPVEKGIKYGANAWVHQRDFKGPNKNNCQ